MGMDTSLCLCEFGEVAGTSRFDLTVPRCLQVSNICFYDFVQVGLKQRLSFDGVEVCVTLVLFTAHV